MPGPRRDQLAARLAPLLSARRPESLTELLAAARQAISPHGLRIVHRRLDATLEEIGTSYGLTRERIRQIQARTNRELRRLLVALTPDLLARWRSMLDRDVVSEDELFEGVLDRSGNLEEQRRFGRVLLGAVGGKTPRLRGDYRWWSNNRDRLRAALRQRPTNGSSRPSGSARHALT